MKYQVVLIKPFLSVFIKLYLLSRIYQVVFLSLMNQMLVYRFFILILFNFANSICSRYIIYINYTTNIIQSKMPYELL